MSDLLDEVEKPLKRRKGFYRFIQHSIEFYMGDANLRNDSYMKKIMSENPEIDPAIFLTFNRINSSGGDVNDILKAVGPSTVLEVTAENKIRRRFPIVEKTKEDVDWCSIYVENIPPDATPDDLLKLFGTFGKVVNVTIPKLRFKKKIAGFAFVEFADFHTRVRALQAFRTYGAIINCNKKVTPSAIQDLEAAVEKKENDYKMELQGNAEKEGKLLDEPAESDYVVASRKNRKKKIRGKVRFMGVKIMSKTTWNLLRNRYLTLQALNRRRIKAHLTKLKKPPQSRPKFRALIPGSIVKAALPNEAVDSDVVSLKAELRQKENVEYVDAKIGESICYIRMNSAEAAATFLTTPDLLPGCQLSLLSPSEESNYLTKIKEDRREKFSKPNPAHQKLSGKKKILARAERQLCYKVKLSADDSSK